MGKDDGEEDNAEPSVDEGRDAHAEDAGARKDKDDCDCAKAEAERVSVAKKCIEPHRR